MVQTKFRLLILFLLTCLSLCKATYTCKKPYLEITVSPNGKFIQINWELDAQNYHSGDWIGLYYGNSDTNDSTVNRVYNFEATGPKGWVQTDKIFSEKIVEDFKNSVILQYRAIYWRKNDKLKHGDEAVVTTRISTYPNWMKFYWNIISTKKLADILIPGTNNSACGDSVKNLGASTQDQDILQQLILGIRYLNINILYDNQEYWIECSGTKAIKLDQVIEQVAKFVSNTANELVIFDIQETKGIPSQQEHLQLINYLKQKFEPNGKKLWVPSNSWSATLKDIVNPSSGGKVIITYNNGDILNTNGLTWSPIKQSCGPVPNNFCIESSGNQVAQTMTSGTSNVSESIHNLFMTKEVGLSTNILSTNYFMGIGTVRKALIWNQRKFQPAEKPGCDSQDRTVYDDQYFQHNIIE